MRIGFSTGYRENYWPGWPWAKMYGGSEHIVVEVASELAATHEVTVRLPYAMPIERHHRGVRWISEDAPSEQYDVLFCFDDFAQRDRATRDVLVACRSDPPPHTDFDQLVFLSKHHAALMGHSAQPAIGGGVRIADYAEPMRRFARRVICTSSPDRCAAARIIGAGFDFVHSYKPVAGYATVELSRDELRELQQTARALIYPLDPRRPSDFFSMAVLEAMAAGTPVVVSDADSMPELWAGAAVVLPRPIDYGAWTDAVEGLLTQPREWSWRSERGRMLAQKYDWSTVAQRYLAAAIA